MAQNIEAFIIIVNIIIPKIIKKMLDLMDAFLLSHNFVFSLNWELKFCVFLKDLEQN